MNSTFVNWLMAAAIATVLAASMNLDTYNHETEWDRSNELKELQASQAQTDRREAAAQALCLQERGPGAVVLWTADGDLVCRARRVRIAGAGI
jgi:hypothetical protein